GTMIQVLNLPRITQGASYGRGMGKRVLAAAQNAVLILFVIDVFQPEARSLLEKELRLTGIRVDEDPPNVVIETTTTGGISVVTQVKLTKITVETVKDILRVYGMN